MDNNAVEFKLPLSTMSCIKLSMPLWVMVKIMEQAKKITSGTFILLWCVGVHFSCFMTILSHFWAIIFNMTRIHSVSKEMQLFLNCLSFGEECIPMNMGLYPGVHDPGSQEKSTKKSCVSFETECSP